VPFCCTVVFEHAVIRDVLYLKSITNNNNTKKPTHNCKIKNIYHQFVFIDTPSSTLDEIRYLNEELRLVILLLFKNIFRGYLKLLLVLLLYSINTMIFSKHLNVFYAIVHTYHESGKSLFYGKSVLTQNVITVIKYVYFCNNKIN